MSEPRMNILLVDDQVGNLLALEAVLGTLGQNLVRARSGPEALRRLLDDDFGLVLMDVQMPEMDGFETAALIRQRDRSRLTPIIFLTAYEQDEAQMFKGYSLGAVDYLFKPIVPEVLRSKTMVFVELFQKTAQIEAQAEQLGENQRREHERELAEQRRLWEIERLREEAAKEKRIAEALTQKAEELALNIAERVRVEEQLRNRALQQAVVAELGQRALAGTPPPALLTEAVTVIARTLEVDACRALELAPDGHSLVLRADSGWGEAPALCSAELEGEWLTAKTLRTGEPVILGASVEDEGEGEAKGPEQPALPPSLEPLGIVSGASVPIHGLERPFGALEAFTRGGRNFTRDDLHFLQAVANVLATAIQRKRDEDALAAIRDELAVQLADMKRLHELSTRLSNARELQPVLTEVLEAVTALQGTHMGLVMLYDRERGDLAPVASLGLGEGYLGRLGRVSGGSGICGTALAERRGLIIEDLGTDHRFPADCELARLADYRAVYCVPLTTSGGEPIGTIAAFFNEPHAPSARETRLVELYTRQAAEFIDNARLNREMREADRRKDEFLAMLGHELRNPLAPILNALRIMGMAEAEGENVEGLRTVAERQVKHLSRLVDDLLDISRINSGKIQLRMEPADLAAIAARAIDTARPLIDSRGHALETSIPAGPLTIQADAARIEQVVANLLNNAAKYTEPGGRIRLEIRREGPEAVIHISDTGIGISSEMLPRIFDLFAQADRSLDRSEGGLGIGLTLVRRLVDLHGGSVSARSEGPGLGSEFVVRLPLLVGVVRHEAAPKRKEGPLSGNGSAHPRRVLVVDDNVDNARTLGRLLKIWGHEVSIAHDGPSALELARAILPDAVVLDIGLPGMDGFQLAQALRESEGLDQTVLIAVTGYGRGEDLQRSREAGIAHHLVKPVDPEALKALLEAHHPFLARPGTHAG